MRALTAFVRLSRPTFLAGGFAGFALGVAIAAYEGAPVTPGRYAAGQAMVTAFQLMTHYANDFYDRAGDGAGGRTEFSGGSGVLVSGALPPGTARIAAAAAAGAGALIVAVFLWNSMIAAAGIGAAMGCLAWVYSAPPFRLSARGWGELDAALVVAVLVPLAGFAVCTGRIDGLAAAATAAPACAMFALMISVEWPDRAADVSSGKRNLVVRHGERSAARIAVAGALLVVPGLLAAIPAGAPLAGGIFALLLAPAVVSFARRFQAPGVPPAELAARGVALFFLTVVFEWLGYIAVLR